MTSVVRVSANPDHDVRVTQQDLYPNAEWVDSQQSVVVAGESQSYYVWNARRIIVEEIADAVLQRSE